MLRVRNLKINFKIDYLLNKLILLDKLFACTGLFYTVFPLFIITNKILLNIIFVLLLLYISRSDICNNKNYWVLFQTLWHINSAMFVGIFGPIKSPIHQGFIELY